jgi:hypothetical protein
VILKRFQRGVKKEVKIKLKHNSVKKIKGQFSKEVKKELSEIKQIFFVILGLSLIQVLLSILGYFPILEKIKLFDKILIFETTEFTIFSLISTIKVGMIFIAGFFFSLKNKFEIKRIVIVSLILLIASLPALLFTERLFSGLPTIIKIVNFGLISLTNLIVYCLLCAFGSLFGEAYKKIKKQSKK